MDEVSEFLRRQRAKAAVVPDTSETRYRKELAAYESAMRSLVLSREEQRHRFSQMRDSLQRTEIPVYLADGANIQKVTKRVGDFKFTLRDRKPPMFCGNIGTLTVAFYYGDELLRSVEIGSGIVESKYHASGEDVQRGHMMDEGVVEIARYFNLDPHNTSGNGLILTRLPQLELIPELHRHGYYPYALIAAVTVCDEHLMELAGNRSLAPYTRSYVNQELHRIYFDPDIPPMSTRSISGERVGP